MDPQQPSASWQGKALDPAGAETPAALPPERATRQLKLKPLSRGARLILLVAGWLMVLLGVAGLVLPGLQGILTLLFGAAILSLVSQQVHAWLRRGFRPWPRGWRQLLRIRQRVHLWFEKF